MGKRLNTCLGLVVAVFLAIGCVGGGGGGGGGTATAFAGGPVGSACAVEGEAGCTFSGGSSITEACQAGAWVVQQTCAAGVFCAIANGAATCGSPSAVGGTDTVGGSDTVGGTDTLTSGADSKTGGGSDGTAADTDTSVVKPPADTKVTATPLTATGAFSAAIDGGQFVVDYTGLPVKAAMVHRLNSNPEGMACVASLQLSVAKADGSCRLELNFAPGFEGEGLRFESAKFFAKVGIKQDGVTISTLPCAGWTKEPANGEVVYQSIGGGGSVNLPPLGQPAASQASASLPNQDIAIKTDTPVVMKFLGRQFVLKLDMLSFHGDLTSKGDAEASCAKTSFPMPQFNLLDISPGSAGFNKTYGLDSFKGKRIVVALVSDWCNSCRSQTQLMQKLQDQAVAAGKNDVQMVLIADKQKSDPTQLTKLVKNIPIFQDVPTVDAWGKMNASHAGKFKNSEIRNSGYGFAKTGAEIMYFAPNGTGSLNLTAFQQAALQVINATD